MEIAGQPAGGIVHAAKAFSIVRRFCCRDRRRHRAAFPAGRKALKETRKLMKAKAGCWRPDTAQVCLPGWRGHFAPTESKRRRCHPVFARTVKLTRL
jgi:hypothetical protein